MEDTAVVVLAVKELASPLDAVFVHVLAVIAVHAAVAPASHVHSPVRPLIPPLSMKHVGLELSIDRAGREMVLSLAVHHVVLPCSSVLLRPVLVDALAVTLGFALHHFVLARVLGTVCEAEHALLDDSFVLRWWLQLLGLLLLRGRRWCLGGCCCRGFRGHSRPICMAVGKLTASFWRVESADLEETRPLCQVFPFRDPPIERHSHTQSAAHQAKMEEFLHLYEMESLSLGITARKDIVEQVKRFFLGEEGTNSGMYRTALAMAARHDHAESKDTTGTDESDTNQGEEAKTFKLVVAGNSKECFRNRLRNIQLLALSKAVVKSRLSGIHALDFCHNYLGEEQDEAITGDAKGPISPRAATADSQEGRGRPVSTLDETPYLLDTAPSLARLLHSSALYTSMIEEINLSGNHIGSETCKLLCAALKESATPLKRLDLSGNPLGVGGGHAIAELLTPVAAAQCKLEELNIGNTGMEVENLIAIATALRDNTTLVSLNLDKPVMKTKEEEAIQHIGKMLQVNETLRVLSLNKHHLTDQGAQVLAERLLDNHTLQRLTLRANNIGSNGATALAALLLRHDSLSEFDLSANRIGDAGAIALAKLLRHNTRPLATLALCSTYLTDDGLVAIAEACLQPRHPDSNNLRNLLLWGNDFGERSSELFLELHRGRFADWDIETDFTPIPSDYKGDDEGSAGASIQIAHRDVRRATEFASPKR